MLYESVKFFGEATILNCAADKPVCASRVDVYNIKERGSAPKASIEEA